MTAAGSNNVNSFGSTRIDPALISSLLASSVGEAGSKCLKQCPLVKMCVKPMIDPLHEYRWSIFSETAQGPESATWSTGTWWRMVGVGRPQIEHRSTPGFELFAVRDSRLVFNYSSKFRFKMVNKSDPSLTRRCWASRREEPKRATFGRPMGVRCDPMWSDSKFRWSSRTRGALIRTAF